MKYIFCLFLSLGFYAFLNSQNQSFQSEINAFKYQDSISFPAAHGILFVGSSSFRLWKNLAQDFKDYPVINRGFGGSVLKDVIRYADKIIYPYHPKQILIYCGENDLAADSMTTAKIVFNRYKTLHKMIRKNLPSSHIVFVSLKPSPSRNRLFDKMQKTNALIKNYLSHKSKAAFVDVYHPMLDKNGQPKEDLFIADKLHMNLKGYAIWTELIRPVLIQ